MANPLAEAIRAYCSENNITYKELAKQANVPPSWVTNVMYRLINGTGWDKVYALSRIMGFNASEMCKALDKMVVDNNATIWTRFCDSGATIEEVAAGTGEPYEDVKHVIIKGEVNDTYAKVMEFLANYKPEPAKIRNDAAAERLAGAIIGSMVHDLKSCIITLPKLSGDSFWRGVDGADKMEAQLRKSELVSIVGLNVDYLIQKTYKVCIGQAKEELIMAKTKYENLEKYVKEHGYKSMNTFFNECKITAGSNTNRFKKTGALSADMTDKIANALDITVETLEDIMAGIYVDYSDFKPAKPVEDTNTKAEEEKPAEVPSSEPEKPLTFEAVKDALEDIQGEVELEDKPKEVGPITTDAELDAAIDDVCGVVSKFKELEEPAKPELPVPEPVSGYLAGLRQKAEEEAKEAYERMVRKNIINECEADIIVAADKFGNYELSEQERLAALCDVLKYGGARIQIAAEEANNNGN